MGNIEVIAGPMFSGKTTELLRRLGRYILAGCSYTAIKPAIDTRTQATTIKTIRGEVDLNPIKVASLHPVKPTTKVVLLDEGQFFGSEIVQFCQTQRDQGRIVIISGLDMDYRRQPFGSMDKLMAIADSVTKLTAICSCGKEAIFTQKLNPDSQSVDIGDKDKYIPVCTDCYHKYFIGGVKNASD